VNPANPAIHYATTGPEIWADTDGQVDALKGEKGPHKIQGIGAGFIPDVLNTDLIDDVLTIDNDAAFGTAKHVAAEDGVPVGISSGAAIAASLLVRRGRLRGACRLISRGGGCGAYYDY